MKTVPRIYFLHDGGGRAGNHFWLQEGQTYFRFKSIQHFPQFLKSSQHALIEIPTIEILLYSGPRDFKFEANYGQNPFQWPYKLMKRYPYRTGGGGPKDDSIQREEQATLLIYT